jgi:hypothetical protein
MLLNEGWWRIRIKRGLYDHKFVDIRTLQTGVGEGNFSMNMKFRIAI